MICSILIPTRKRPHHLSVAIDSIWKTCKPQDVEIICRTDDDDHYQTNIAVGLVGPSNVLTGPRLKGYFSINQFYTDMAVVAKAPWIWLFNDECTISGEWVDDLKAIPTTGVVVQPLSYQVGHSMYKKVHDTTCPIVPNRYWELGGQPGVPYCTDTDTYMMLNKHLGWRTEYLPKLHMAHFRFTDEEYRKHHYE